jgi:hypothetical protein
LEGYWVDNWCQNHWISGLSSKTSELAWPNMAPQHFEEQLITTYVHERADHESQYNVTLSDFKKEMKKKRKKVEHICIIREVFTSI